MKTKRCFLTLLFMSLVMVVMADNDYYLRQALSYQSDAEYYIKQAQSHEKNEEYYDKEAKRYFSIAN